MTMSGKKVAVIGAGVSGIACVKACLDEGLTPTCFEQFQGLWHFTPDVHPGQGAVAYESLMTNTSKSMTCFSDMPFPDSAPQYLSHTQFKEYLERYVETFDLNGYIHLQHRVINVHPSTTFQEEGSWLITAKDLANDVVKIELFQRVVICNGRHRLPLVSNIPGMDNFQGEIMHAISYRKDKQFWDKTVLVIDGARKNKSVSPVCYIFINEYQLCFPAHTGNSNSAGDIAVEACKCAKKVYLSIGGGTWINRRQGNDAKGPNLDYSLKYILNYVPLCVINWIAKWISNTGIDDRRHGIAPASSKGPFYSTFLVNEKITDLIRSGNVAIKPSIARFDSRVAWFSDGSQVDDIDMVVLATGYKPEWKLISNQHQPYSWEEILPYKMVWPTHLTHHTLAFVGLTRIRGLNIPSLELQARWVAAVFSSRLHLPTADQMNQDVTRRKEGSMKRFGYVKLSVDGLYYQSELADELCIRPPFFRTLFTRPMDLYRWYLGPCFPMLHRLYGAHQWTGARDAIRMALRSAENDRNRRVHQGDNRGKID